MSHSATELTLLKEEFEAAKATLNEKVRSLEATLNGINQAYHLNDNIRNDREKIVRDYHRETNSSEPAASTIRATILQNQQLVNELEFQSKQTVGLLERN